MKIYVHPHVCVVIRHFPQETLERFMADAILEWSYVPSGERNTSPPFTSWSDFDEWGTMASYSPDMSTYRQRVGGIDGVFHHVAEALTAHIGRW